MGLLLSLLGQTLVVKPEPTRFKASDPGIVFHAQLDSILCKYYICPRQRSTYMVKPNPAHQ